MKKRTTIKQIFISIGLFIAIYLLFEIIFDVIAMGLFSEYQKDSEVYTHPLIIIFSFVLALFFTLFEWVIRTIKYSEFLKNNAEKMKSNINIYTNKRIRLYKKATLIFQSYLDHEQNTQTTIAKERNKQSIEIHSSIDFRQALENYPNLKAENNISKLLDQMEKAEIESTDMKQIYNNDVAMYNETATQFIIKLFTKNQKMDFYEEELLEDSYI